MENSKIKFILASKSPRRKELIGHLNFEFEVKTKNTPEESVATDPVEFSLDIAGAKGDAIVKDLPSFGHYLIVSADTIVCLDGVIFGKPKDRDEARTYLKVLSGRTHSVYTAVAVQYMEQGLLEKFSFVEESKVTFNKISPDLMELYLDTGDSLDKAGAYGIQGPSLTFISRVEGDYANVVGFPLSRFVNECSVFFQTKFLNEASWLKLF